MEVLWFLWAIVWKYVLSLGAVGILLIVAFVPISWIPLVARKLALWAAGIVVTWTLAYGVGLRDGERHANAKCVAEDTHTETAADKAWQGAERSVPVAAERVPNDPADPADRDNAADNRKGIRPADHLFKLNGHR